HIGLGFEAALQLSKMGASIIIASSNYQKSLLAVEKLKILSKNSNITCEFLDLSSFQSVKEFCELFLKKYNKLDTLICNSGISMCKFELTEDNYERTLQVNYLGHAMLTLHLLPILKK
ncbi:NAD(P)-binding protein, partial [Conidiobolus coronatus NRRL 28638]